VRHQDFKGEVMERNFFDVSRQTILVKPSSSFPKLLFFIAMLMMTVIIALVISSTDGQLFNPKTYYTFSGTEGPYLANDNILDTTKITSKFHAGDTLGYINTICAASGVQISSVVDLVRVKDNQVIDTVRRDALQARCGTVVITRKLPKDLAPGLYEIRRQFLFYRKGSNSISDTLPTIKLEIIE
jgi:hypothetical protein